jgi:hypothetical protein
MADVVARLLCGRWCAVVWVRHWLDFSAGAVAEAWHDARGGGARLRRARRKRRLGQRGAMSGQTDGRWMFYDLKLFKKNSVGLLL